MERRQLFLAPPRNDAHVFLRNQGLSEVENKGLVTHLDSSLEEEF
jgi:hypothetical protein